MKYARVVLGLPVEGPFTYLIPGRLSRTVGIGQRVLVPFGKRKATGYVVGFSSVSGTKRKIKEIEELIDEEQVISPEFLKLTRWLADYYFCAWGEAIEAAIPPILRKGKKIQDSSPLSSSPDERRGEDVKLTVFHQHVLRSIEEGMAHGKKEVFLMQNMCDEDRRSVYLKAVELSLKQGKSSIILVPQISLVSPLEKQLRLKFGDGAVASLHSRFSPARLYREWERIRTQQYSVVVGTRSAVFAPVKNLKLIIVDEEGDSAYKQIEVPRYNAKEVALKRAELSAAVVILGSVLPSIESYLLAKTKKYELIRTTCRKNPELRVVNMCYEHRKKQKTKPLISSSLESGIKDALANKEKIILFLNRRGFATFIHCPGCKSVLRCKNCYTALKYHFKARLAACHRCGYKITAPEICPECNVAYIRYTGSGTQRLESELHRLFPSARILRIDSDAGVERADFRYKEADILVGTQIIAKMHFAPSPALIGIISLDILLNMPGFRGSEHAFQLLFHFANSLKKGGNLLVQTYFPEHYILQFMGERDCFKFYEAELIQRRDLKLPPFKHLAVLTLRGKSEDKLIVQAQGLVDSLIEKKPRGAEILGPLPAPVSKIRGKYQQNIIIKAKNMLSVNKFLKENLKGFTRSRIDNIPLTVDVDPL